MKPVAILPARIGSKRISQKNIKIIDGIPLIGHTLINLVNSNIFDEIIVSSDSDEILNISKLYGSTISYKRSKKLSDDFTSTSDVIVDVINSLGLKRELVCSIYPTAILLNGQILQDSLKVFRNCESNFLVSAYETPTNSFRTFTLSETGKINLIHPNFQKYRSQDLIRTYADAGLFYWALGSDWIKIPNILDNNSNIYLVDRIRAIDLNTYEDLQILEIAYHFLKDQN